MSCCRDRLCFTGSDSDEACPLVICQQERMEQGMPQVCIMNLMGRGLKWRLEKVKVEELSRPSESWLNQRGLRASLWRDATSEVETCWRPRRKGQAFIKSYCKMWSENWKFGVGCTWWNFKGRFEKHFQNSYYLGFWLLSGIFVCYWWQVEWCAELIAALNPLRDQAVEISTGGHSQVLILK